LDNIADDNEVEYTYDAMGRRIMRNDVDTNTWTKYYYDGLTVIAEKKKVGAGSWDWNRIFTVSPGVIGNVFRISNKSGEIWGDEYYHYDALGNLAFTTLGDSTPGYSFDQEAYGNVKVGSQSGYHLTTKEYDSILEIYYFTARWYDTLLGRFISKAPYPLHVEHPYVFSVNDPINNFDYSGRSVRLCSGNGFFAHRWLEVGDEGRGFYPIDPPRYWPIGQPGVIWDERTTGYFGTGNCSDWEC
jgi:RHS repeat-associated protein